MKKNIIIAILIASAVTASAQYNSKNLSISKNADEGFTYDNLRIFPIMANRKFVETFKNVGNYLTLSKALDEKKVIITESVDTTRSRTHVSNLNEQYTSNTYYSSESVNNLLIENVSNDTVLVMAGEVVQGGKQNRMVGQDFLLAPHSGKKDLSVFCVEEGRWTYNNGAKFLSDHHYSSNKMRKIAIVNKNQEQVWNEVENVNSKNNVSSKSHAYTDLQESKEFKTKLDAYVSYFKNTFSTMDSLIGFVACSGDTIIGCDMFATKTMLDGQMESLLQSYSTDAITNGSKPTVNKSKAQTFLNKFLSDENSQDKEVEKSGYILKNKGRKLAISKF